MDRSLRAASARRAYLGARKWATIVMGLSWPFVFGELISPMLMWRGFEPVEFTLVVLASIALCGGFWGIWVGSASLAGWMNPSAEPP